MKSDQVIKHVLANGLTILIKPSHAIPKVSTQLWYNVGSKDEKSGERGIAHLIEHMIFKGTKKLSECDINLITHRLSGYTNAFTSYDYTGYLFDFPSQNWEEALPIMADCMRNCTLKEEFLASELKAVIQELKMYKDDYNTALLESMISAIFGDHPYHHPIIGYKHDLWSLKRETMVQFYEHHYLPNNATLVIVGDVSVDAALTRAEKEFGHIKPDKSYVKEQYYHALDLKSQSVTLYRDIKIPQAVFAWVIPGAKTGNDYLVEILSWILGSGRGSRLFKKIVDELELATDLDAFTYDLFDYAVLFVYVQPKEAASLEKIREAIFEELRWLEHNTVSHTELSRAIKKTEAEHLSTLESNQKQAYGIGKFFLATGDEQYVYTFTEGPKDHLAYQIKDLIQVYIRPSLMHKGVILPLAADERNYWLKLQELSDEEDQRILSARGRVEVVEGGKCVVDIKSNPPKPFTYPRALVTHLDNGLKVLSCQDPRLPKIDLIMDFEAKYFYDPKGKEGLSSFVANLLLEGTKNYSAEQFIDTLDSYGMTIESVAGHISLNMLEADLAKGLELLNEILINATFEEKAIEKVRDQMLAELNEFWDTPSQFITQLARENIYKDHPYSKNHLGTVESVKSITRDDILEYYKKYISPRGARLAIVGDIESHDLQNLLNKKFAHWHGHEVKPPFYPAIEPVKKHQIQYPILRDQTVLCYAGLSVDRMDPDYDKLLLFDQVFTGGLLSSMASRLFDLREQSGLFYTIGGSLLYRVDKQKGLILVKTIVSNDRLAEAEKAIEEVINTAIDTLTEDELGEARQAIVNTLVDNFASYIATAATLLFKDKFDLPDDYFDNRPARLNAITRKDVQETVRKYLTTQKMITIRVGRV